MKKYYLIHCFFITICLFITKLHAQNFNKEVAAEINIDLPKEDLILIRSIAKNMTNSSYSLHYKFSTIVKDSSTIFSKEAYSNRFVLNPYENKLLDEIHVKRNDTLLTIVLLLIYNDDELISTQREEIGLGKLKKKVSSFAKMNEGLIVRGLVTENTKTKAGRDFYDLFYQKCNLNPLKSDKIIKVDEMINFGRSTRVMVKIDNQIIYQFIAQPRLDFLRNQAEIAVSYLNKYLQKQKQIEQYQVKY